MVVNFMNIPDEIGGSAATSAFILIPISLAQAAD